MCDGERTPQSLGKLCLPQQDKFLATYIQNSPVTPTCAHFMCGGPTDRPAAEAARDNPRCMPRFCRRRRSPRARSPGWEMRGLIRGRPDRPTSLPSRFCAHSNPITTGRAYIRERLGCVIPRLGNASWPALIAMYLLNKYWILLLRKQTHAT